LGYCTGGDSLRHIFLQSSPVAPFSVSVQATESLSLRRIKGV
jgi:hypothetical protein